MDGVLADFEGEFLQCYREKFPDREYVPFADRKVFYLHDEYADEYNEDLRSIYSSEGFFLSLPVIPGSQEAVKGLQELGHEVFICSSPVNRFKHCVQEKYLWVAKHFGHELTKRIILTKDKTLIRGDILIDDKPEHKGKLVPSWEHVLYDAPYNKDIRDKRRISWDNWISILD